MSESNDRLISTLIESIKDTNASMQHLSSSIDKLIIDNKIREEKDKRQDETNKKVEDFMNTSLPVINRSSRAQVTFDKALIPLIVMIVVAAGTALGFMPK